MGFTGTISAKGPYNATVVSSFYPRIHQYSNESRKIQRLFGISWRGTGQTALYMGSPITVPI